MRPANTIFGAKSPHSRESLSLSQPHPDRVLHVPEAVAPQMLAAVPARDDNNGVVQALTLQHPTDHKARAAFAIVILDRPALQQKPPSIMRSARELLVPAQRFDKGFRLFWRCRRPARNRIARAAIRNHVLHDPHANSPTRITIHASPTAIPAREAAQDPMSFASPAKGCRSNEI